MKRRDIDRDYRMNPIIQEPLPLRPEETSCSSDIEFMECAIGGYRFGIPISQVIHTDTWCSDYLDSLPGAPTGVVGQTRWDDRWLPVLDLRLLFCLDTQLDQSDVQMFLVADHHDDWFILLIDGLISSQCMPLTTFKSFTSLYVSDVRWLSGALIFDDAVVPILDVGALNAHSQAHLDRHESMGPACITAPLLKEGP